MEFSANPIASSNQYSQIGQSDDLPNRSSSSPQNSSSGVRVSGGTISWPSNGWYEVQYASSFNTVSEGGQSASLDPGVYNVINHTTGERFDNIEVGQDTSVSSPNSGIIQGRSLLDELRDAPSTTDRLGGANSHTDTNNEANSGNSVNSVDVFNYPGVVNTNGLTEPISRDEWIQNGNDFSADVIRVDNTVSVQYGNDNLPREMFVGGVAGGLGAGTSGLLAAAVGAAIGVAIPIAIDGEVNVTITTTPRRDANFSENDSNNHGGGGGSDFGDRTSNPGRMGGV